MNLYAPNSIRSEVIRFFSRIQRRGFFWGFIAVISYFLSAIRKGRGAFLKRWFAEQEKKAYYANYKPGNEVRAITLREFNALCRTYPFFIGEYYDSRWDYYSGAISIINKELPGVKRILELGPYVLPICKGSDTMDKESFLPGLTYLHDATKVPWPIKDSSYDLFIGLQVWEHLSDKQEDAFKEVMRIAKMAIVSFPYEWFCPGDVHHGIDGKKISRWTLNFKPDRILPVGERVIYFWRFSR
jgi:hypothetical protein